MGSLWTSWCSRNLHKTSKDGNGDIFRPHAWSQAKAPGAIGIAGSPSPGKDARINGIAGEVVSWKCIAATGVDSTARSNFNAFDSTAQLWLRLLVQVFNVSEDSRCTRVQKTAAQSSLPKRVNDLTMDEIEAFVSISSTWIVLWFVKIQSSGEKWNADLGKHFTN